jgi:hypothetical protein
MYPISGAATRVPEDATAFAYRNGGWAGVIAGGGYVNMMMEDDGNQRVRAALGFPS